MDISLAGKIILWADLILFGFLCLVVWVWQWKVLRGGSMPNPDGSVDDWHEQRLFYGVAVADLLLAVPVALVGIALIIADQPVGYYLTGLASFWFLWTNVTTTVTSLRFEHPRITISWLVVFPFGAVVGLVYIIWSLVYFEEVFARIP